MIPHTHTHTHWDTQIFLYTITRHSDEMQIHRKWHQAMFYPTKEKINTEFLLTSNIATHPNWSRSQNLSSVTSSHCYLRKQKKKKKENKKCLFLVFLLKNKYLGKLHAVNSAPFCLHYCSSELLSLPYYLKRLQPGLYIVATLYLEAG